MTGHLSAATFPSMLGLPVAAKVVGLHGFNLLSHHLKYVAINIHGADIDQWERDTEQYTFLLPGHTAWRCISFMQPL